MIKVSSIELVHFAQAVLLKAGLSDEPALVSAQGLVEADLYGHTTHGLALLKPYVREIEAGSMARDGHPEVINDFGAMSLWDARRLPGIWTTQLAVAEACQRSERFGLGAVTLRNSHHIACLATFLEPPARAGKVVLVLSSDPSSAHVAPFGGTTAVMTPNPIAMGIPATPDPILIDISTSITTAGACGRALVEGTVLPGAWLLDSTGLATDDPRVLKDGGTIMPIGGADHGHKGFGLGLMVEVLTQGLAGFGRADEPKGWGASVLVLVFDPRVFGGSEAFLRQVDWLADACLRSPPPVGSPSVRLPGRAAFQRKSDGLADGVPLSAEIFAQIEELAVKFSQSRPPILQ